MVYDVKVVPDAATTQADSDHNIACVPKGPTRWLPCAQQTIMKPPENAESSTESFVRVRWKVSSTSIREGRLHYEVT